ncbi:MAG: hypothetical protein HOJ79_06560 [Nitrospina sp.]|jgi:hypothetical protein|nr:hypothetical protein [Nitrospina sp.]
MNSLNSSAFLYRRTSSSPEELWSQLKKQYFKAADSHGVTNFLVDWKSIKPISVKHHATQDAGPSLESSS